MKIIIGGAGEVGTHLSKLLSKEDRDIILLDQDAEKLNFPNNMEIMTVQGNPTSIQDLKTVGIKAADMFIAVMPEESMNMTACMLAHTLGAKRTVARVENDEYLLPRNTVFFAELGVDSLICPEILAADEIVSALKQPWTRQWWDIANGQLILLGAKIRQNAPIVNKYLHELGSDERIYHIVAIKRNDETIIPRGSDQILNGDIVYFSTTKQHINEVKALAGKEDINIQKITIMGGSRIALKVCERLPHTVNIKLLEADKEKSYRLAEKVGSNVMVINGDGRNTDLLIQENIRSSDAFIALTGNSEANILACVASKNFGVAKTIAEVENLDYIQMAEKLDIGSIINKKLIASSHIYRFLLQADVSTVKCLAFANAEVAELVARSGAKVTKKAVKDLRLPHDMTLGGLIRDGKAEIIDGNTHIQAGDHVLVFCLSSAMWKIEDYFN
ncbi:MAG: Trk system potassium uptake protein TrkA [Candidatus Ordinivivax streblomastigis]|uniref:Trk system potassium uptake protein TrkA n=1 Tax=Candidatus Ordinivivax streblomastigis TaxID=2540710 RepID=A0A5M8P551_9BACT|nr:MAG: Trk system potassium uptake protein TrkA [Candidatus Ordinivivax streblomastigis]